MNNFGRIQKLALDLMANHGVASWAFEFVDSTDFLARCVYAVNRHGVAYRKKIQYSKAFIGLSVKRATEIILHEIAHALEFEQRGDSDHGPGWQSIALSIGLSNPTAKIELDKSEFPFGIYQGNRLVTGIVSLTDSVRRTIMAFGNEFVVRDHYNAVAVS